MLDILYKVIVVSIGERIVSLRKELNISQSRLAGLLDVSRQAVSKWENDITAPDTLNLIRLADALDTDAEYLATGNHSTIQAPPRVITMVQPVEKIVEVEKIIEKPVEIEKIVELEKVVETVIEKPVIKKVYRTKYIRNPLEYMMVGVICFVFGIMIGLLL